MILNLVQGISFKNPFSKLTSAKDRLKSWLYIIFYVLFAISLFTGIMIVNGPKGWKDLMETIHINHCSIWLPLSLFILEESYWQIWARNQVLFPR